MRLNRFLASAGQGSRRSCEELIRAGQVTVNGVVCTELATQVEPEDVIKIGNRVLHSAPSRTMVIHKPRGFVCTASDELGRRTIFDLLPPNSPRLFHVGRLDKESEGLLILTNDGDLSLKLTHPRYKLEKEYEVVLDKPFDFDLTPTLLHGMNTPEGWARAESAFRLGGNKLKIILTQGLKRQIRLMFYELGYEVTRLVRTRIGTLSIEGMPPASWRVLTRKDIDALLASGKEAKKSTSRSAPKSAPRAKTAPANRKPAPKATATGKTGAPARKPTSGNRASETPSASGLKRKPTGSATPKSSKPLSKAPSRSAAPTGSARKTGSRAHHQHPRLSSRSEDDPSRSRREGSPRRASR